MDRVQNIQEVRTKAVEKIKHHLANVQVGWYRFFINRWVNVQTRERTYESLGLIFNDFFKEYRLTLNPNYRMINLNVEDANTIAKNCYETHKAELTNNIICYLSNALMYDLITDVRKH